MDDVAHEQPPPGWDPGWAAAWSASSPGPGLTPARVVRIDKGGITTSAGGADEQLVVAAKAVRRVVVGDMVGVDAAAGRIESILPRRTVFERRSPGVGRDQVQVLSRALASNMDVVLVLQGLDGGVNAPRLARELVLAWESGAEPVVVLTKTDLVPPDEVAAARAQAEAWAPGVQVVCLSARTADG
ncbi:MAG: GTPase RsgA, partial [Actinomycetes bacterium]